MPTTYEYDEILYMDRKVKGGFVIKKILKYLKYIFLIFPSLILVLEWGNWHNTYPISFIAHLQTEFESIKRQQREEDIKKILTLFPQKPELQMQYLKVLKIKMQSSSEEIKLLFVATFHQQLEKVWIDEEGIDVAKEMHQILKYNLQKNFSLKLQSQIVKNYNIVYKKRIWFSALVYADIMSSIHPDSRIWKRHLDYVKSHSSLHLFS
jgi:hypothetical protein